MSRASYSRNLIAALTLGVCGLFARDALAVPAHVLQYRGYLEQNGTAVNGNVTLRFRIYAVTGASEVMKWSETISNIAVANGSFVATLGLTTPIAGCLEYQGAGDTGERYLAVAVVDGATTIPLIGKQWLGTVPYAFGSPPGASFTVGGDLEVGANTWADPDEWTDHIANGGGTSMCGAGQFVIGIYNDAGTIRFRCADL